MNADVFVKGLDYGTPLHRVIIQLIVANHSVVYSSKSYTITT
jgi:hypothetical protein